jgi:hypothetical protein
MKRSPDHLRVEGSRQELTGEIRRLAEGWDHLGNGRLAQEAAQAVSELAQGASSVRVGHTVYGVTDDTPTPTIG